MNRKDSNSTFVFDSYSINKILKEVRLVYRLRNDGKETLFEEVLNFPKNLEWNKLPEDMLNAAMRSLHLVSGVSYWKTYCPRTIEIPYYSMRKGEASFWNKLYTDGMGEFYYTNKIDFRGLVRFPYTSLPKGKLLKPKNYQLRTKNKSLLFFGGGKDSWTSAELLKKSKKDFTFFAVVAGDSQTIKKMMPKGSIVVERQVDPLLHEISNREGAHKGHVPISMIWTMIGELAAMLYGYRYVIASNERSAEYGNLRYLGLDVNHQWSKSFTAEKALQNYSKEFMTPSVVYFSLLRPLYEFKIVEIFSRLGKKHFRYFTSCNKNFRMSEKEPRSKWCRECPKCAFVFTLLSAFLPRRELVKIFSESLYDKKSLEPIFKELLGLDKFKPFECVGTPEEMILALFMAYKSGEYKGSNVMNIFEKTILNKDINILKIQRDLMKVYNNHSIPKEFVSIKKLMNKI